MEVITPGRIIEESSNAKGKWKAKRGKRKKFIEGLAGKTRKERRAAKYARRAEKRHAVGRSTIKELWLKKKATWSKNKQARIDNRIADKAARELEMNEDQAVTGPPETQVVKFKDEIPEVVNAQTKDGKAVLVKDTPIGKKEVKAEDLEVIIVDGKKVKVDKTDVKGKEIKTEDGKMVVELDESEVSEVNSGDGTTKFYRNEDVTDSTGWWSGLSTKKKVLYVGGMVVASGITILAIIYAKKAAAAGKSGAAAAGKGQK